MTQTIGPFTTTTTPPIVTGQAFQVDIPLATVAIQVHNDTPFRLYVQFDGDKPTATSSVVVGGYDGMASPWAHPVIPRQQSLGSYSPFNGKLWIMVVDPTSVLAQTGSISTLAEIHIDCYMPNEQWPQAWAIPRQQDVTSQARMIALPPGGGQLLNGTWSTATFATLGVNIFTLSATNIQLQAAVFYLFHLGLYPQIPAAAGVPQQTRCALQAQFQTGGFVNVGLATTLYLFPMITTFNAANDASAQAIVLQPFFPIVAPLTVPATAAFLVINLVKLGGNDAVIQFNFQMEVDPNNAGPPASYGGNFGPNRWAGQYSNTSGLW